MSYLTKLYDFSVCFITALGIYVNWGEVKGIILFGLAAIATTVQIINGLFKLTVYLKNKRTKERNTKK